MIEFSIPGYGDFIIENLVLDFNGTIAFDGKLTEHIIDTLNELADQLKVYILTADTFGTVKRECAEVNAEVIIFDQANGVSAKETFIEKLGSSRTIAIGNGMIDVAMLTKAALGMVILGPEGCAGQALARADIVVKDINDGLGMLMYPKRLVATMRQ